MKKYITAALASASLIVGASVFAQDLPQTMPVQKEPGRQYDRARLPNPATGNVIDEPAGSDAADTESGMKAKAASPSGFIQKVSEANQAEIRLAQLAEEKSASPQVKSLAQHLSQDHQANADKLSQLAQQKNVQVSNEVSAKCQKQIDQLSALSGPAFDKKYVHDMIRDHKKNIAFFQDAAANNTDPDVKAFAQSTLPTLEEHLQMAQRDASTINEPAGAAVAPYSGSGVPPSAEPQK